MDMQSTQNLGLQSRYNLLEKIGEGSFGKVFRAQDGNGEIVAIKVIPDEILHQQEGLVAQLLQQEINTMYAIDNPNVVKIICYIFHLQKHYIVMEYCDSGNLRQYINKKGKLPQGEALSLFKQILNGIKGLREKQIMHRDLKLENIFLHENTYVKIGDLGFSKQLKHKDDQDDLYLGSPGTMAPEVVKKQPYGFQADVFSIGVLIYQMLYGRLPFENYQDQNQYLMQINRNKINFEGNNSVNEEMKDLIKQMLKEDPNQRISIDEIDKHSIFKQEDIQFSKGLNSANLNSLNNLQAQQIKDDEKNNQFYEEVEKSVTQIIHDSQNKVQLSEGKGLIDWSEYLKKPQNYERNSLQQQQNQNNGMNTYTTPRSDQDSQQCQIFPMQPSQISITLKEEQQINELLEKYIYRFNSIQYLLNTLNEISGVEFPNVFPIIYPQMFLHKKAITEFRRFHQQLLQKYNIFDSTVFEKIIQNPKIRNLTERLKYQIEDQINIYFFPMYKSQVDENEQDLRKYIQRYWALDNQLEPSQYFDENYNQALQLILDIILKLKQNQPSAILVKLDKLEAHLKRCLQFQQLLQDKIELEMEFNLQ